MRGEEIRGTHKREEEEDSGELECEIFANEMRARGVGTLKA